MKTYCVTLTVKKEYQSDVEADSLVEAYAKALDDWQEELSEKDLDHLDIQAEEVLSRCLPTTCDDDWDWMYTGNIGRGEI